MKKIFFIKKIINKKKNYNFLKNKKLIYILRNFNKINFNINKMVLSKKKKIFFFYRKKKFISKRIFRMKRNILFLSKTYSSAALGVLKRKSLLITKSVSSILNYSYSNLILKFKNYFNFLLKFKRKNKIKLYIKKWKLLKFIKKIKKIKFFKILKKKFFRYRKKKRKLFKINFFFRKNYKKINNIIFNIKTNRFRLKRKRNKIYFKKGKYKSKRQYYSKKFINTSHLLFGARLFKNTGISKEFYIRFVSLIDFSIFRTSNIMSIVRLNYYNNEFVRLVNNVNYLFTHFKKKGYNYLFITINFAMLIFTKDIVKFTIFLRTLLRYADRKKQRNFFYILSSISSTHFLDVLNLYNIHGLFIKVSGKIGGFAGDRTRFFFVRYGSISRSIRTNKYNFYQKQLNTDNGTSGITTLILYN